MAAQLTRRSMLGGTLATAAVWAARPGLAEQTPASFRGRNAGEERVVDAIELSWCPPGRFVMGSPPGEPERRPGEDQVEVTLTRGFWMAKHEATQGQWNRVVGKLPGELTAELPAGDDFPLGNVNFAEAEGFCQKLTEIAWAGALGSARQGYRARTSSPRRRNESWAPSSSSTPRAMSW